MKRNLIIAAAITLLLAAWMAIGTLRSPAPSSESAADAADSKPPPSVRVRDSTAVDYTSQVILRGKTEPARTALLRAEVGGQVISLPIARGARVKQGELLIQLDPKGLPQQVEAAEALAAQREMENNAATKLQATGFQSETRLAESLSLLAEARQQLAAARIALGNTEIRAPFDGVFNERQVELGEFVSQGDPVATFLELDPMVVSAEATELEIQKLRQGAEATARIGDRDVPGTLRYISSAANDAVRTFTVELVFDNADADFQAGMTADIVYALEPQRAHKVSPALLFLSANTEGDLGVKTIDEAGVVSFHTVELLGSESDGFWVGGLPDDVRIITVGQGFVKPGVTVQAVDEASVQ